jgi:hypothetical protein
MKTSLKLLTGVIFVAVAIFGTATIVHGGGTRAIGVIAVITDSNNNVTSISSSIAVGKTSAAGTASIVGNETATSAVAGGGIVKITNTGTTAVGYQIDAESATELGTASTFTAVSPPVGKVDINSNPTVITIQSIP